MVNDKRGSFLTTVEDDMKGNTDWRNTHASSVLYN